jgi:hypothetical protein
VVTKTEIAKINSNFEEEKICDDLELEISQSSDAYPMNNTTQIEKPVTQLA